MRHAQTLAGLLVLLLGAVLAPPATAATQQTLRSAQVLRPLPLDEVVKGRSVRVLVHWSRIDYFLDKGLPRGVAAEMARDFEVFLNKELKTGRRPIAVVVVPVSRDKLVSYLEEGRGEIAFSGVHPTPELAARIDFSAPLMTGISEVVLRNKSLPAITADDDLSGKVVSLRPGSGYLTTLREVNRRLHARGLPEARVSYLSEYLADADILELVDAGLVDYTILDSHRGDFLATLFPNVVADTGHPLATDLSVHLGVRKGAVRLRALLDKFVSTHRAGSAYGNTLLRRYLKDNPWARRATSPAELQRFQQMVGLFRRYGEQYGFDPLMLAAQGFQESGLNQKRRSHVGAIGVMQLMPKTGKSLKVGDIRKLEPNIHAGTKYMDQLRDTYFNDPGIDDLNRTLFCFAAYNAGPTRISRLRKQAAQEGLNPNLWFDNVERVVAREVSQETVQYVLNISKYYVAYSLVEEQNRRREAALKAMEGVR